jgi:hypothetical protein
MAYSESISNQSILFFERKLSQYGRDDHFRRRSAYPSPGDGNGFAARQVIGQRAG